MSAAGIRLLAEEVRRIGSTLAAADDPGAVGSIGVSGVLADQLAKELSAGAAAGAVIVGGEELAGRAEVLVRIVAGDPTPEDDAFVRAAQMRDVPVVVVQLWPQADWTRPFVLTPFVVECRAGEGFPVDEIASRIAEAVEKATLLAARAPALADAIRARLVRGSVLRAAIIGAAGSRYGSSRPLLTLEQIRLLSELRSASGAPAAPEEFRARAAGAALVAGTGLGLRGLARSLREVVPAPLANAAVAAVGTWALARAYQAAELRLPRQ